jgi:hypothetical protein
MRNVKFYFIFYKLTKYKILYLFHMLHKKKLRIFESVMFK